MKTKERTFPTSIRWASSISWGSLLDREVGLEGALRRGHQAREDVRAGESREVGLLAQGEDDPLLAGGAVEVGGAVARAGVDEGLGAGHVLDAGRDVDPQLAGVARVVVVDDGQLDVDRDAAEGVDDLPEAGEVDLHEVLDLHAVEPAEGVLEGLVAAELAAREEVRPGARLLEEGVDLAVPGSPEDGARRDIGQRDPRGVAGQAEHGDLARRRVDAGDDEGVGVVGALAGATVGADQQDVEAALAVPRGEGRPAGDGGRAGGCRRERRFGRAARSLPASLRRSRPARGSGRRRPG